jgi:hypothetical protein
MTLYSFVLFAHITGVLAMFACLSLEVLSLSRLRRASTLSEVQLWIEPVPRLSRIALGSLLVILLTGVFLTIQMSGFGLAWLKVTIAAFLLMAPLGAASGRRIGYVQRLSGNGKMNQSEILDLLRRPFLKISLAIRIAVFLGIVLLMTAKPGLPESLAIAGGSVVLGLASAFLIPSGRSTLSAPRTHPTAQ